MAEIDNQETESSEAEATEETTAEETTEDAPETLRDALKEAFEASEKEETEEATEEVDEEAEEEETEDEAEEILEFKAPSSWNKAERELFESLDPDIKDILAKHDKSRQADYTRKTQEVADQRKEIESLADLTEPHKEEFKRLGIKPADYFNNLMQIDSQLSKDPAGTIRQFVEKFGLKADDLGFTVETESKDEDSDDDYLTDTEVRQNKRIAELEKKLAKNDNQVKDVVKSNSLKEEQAAVQKVLKEFEDATDDDGNALHPHFKDADVKADMFVLVERGKTLEEAYKLAPAVRQIEFDKKNKETPEAKTIRKKGEIAKAKKAGKRVKSSSAGEADLSTLSLKDEMRSRMNSAGIRF